ncbi:hypothetical protein HRH59_07825 [Rheinheimera sp. YQF-2]|jgi:hypothetical protein|uniref:Uncharacterized protein n=1 Tax=Rheinheimera lutimaris TaxID=2740584 RepID=A0A7Y5EHH6_9GAMM|nr:hypothetical protein [Rheinheimera lutimaris]NRQ42480.1 hypothetical protein [Rheinheimera lutimaris]
MPGRDPLTNTVRVVESNQRRKLTKALPLQQGEISNLSFWVSQISMIIATILGVYLAAQQGLRQAVVFEQIQSDKSNYYLRKSLQQELSDNLQLIKTFTEQIKGVGTHNIKRHSLTLDTFVWESMKFSPATLETPPALLSESRKFYREVNDIHGKILSSFYSPHYGTTLLLAQVEHMETVVLPMFEADTSQLKQALSQQEVEVE